MYKYYQSCPSTVNGSAQTQATTSSKTATLSKFDKHHETLLSEDTEEAWASELRRYLGTMQRDVTKQTDIVKWWQISKLKLINLIVYLPYIL
jgi:hypothetical protein